MEETNVLNEGQEKSLLCKEVYSKIGTIYGVAKLLSMELRLKWVRLSSFLKVTQPVTILMFTSRLFLMLPKQFLSGF